MEIETEIEHFLHDHHLSLIQDQKDSERFRCSGCEKRLSSPSYGCSYCGFFLHKSCSQIQRQLQHYFHPCPLELTISGDYACNACFKDCSGFSFSCQKCLFDMDLECALTPTTVNTEDDGQIQHFTHRHPLQLVDLNKEQDEVCCSICDKLCSDVIHGCKKCNFFLHHSCMDIPQVINQHQFHPKHSLVLNTFKWYTCRGCDKYCKGFAYKCQPCLFELDAECALLPTANCEGAKRIQHVYHHHPLELCEIEDVCEARCWACRENSPGPHFMCHRRKFFLHQSCAIDFLPQTIPDHPFHPNHCLKIKSYSKGDKRISCKACGISDSAVLGYCCVDCSNFEFHLDCSKLRPFIKYGSHQHLFPLFQKIGFHGFCFVCKDRCNSFFLRCVSCDITLHLQCHPLAPKTLKHKHHRHPLTLTKSPLDSDLEYYGDRDEYYCDFCELARPAECPVYYCKDCDLSADIRCFISELCIAFSHCRGNGNGVGEDKDDNLREDKSCSTTDPKVVKFDEEIEEVTAELKRKEFKRKELIAQVQALQSELEELSNVSSELEERRKNLEHKRLSCI